MDILLIYGNPELKIINLNGICCDMHAGMGFAVICQQEWDLRDIQAGM